MLVNPPHHIWEVLHDKEVFEESLAALAAALMMALMFIPAGAYAVYAADVGNTVVVGVNADYGISRRGRETARATPSIS